MHQKNKTKNKDIITVSAMPGKTIWMSINANVDKVVFVLCWGATPPESLAMLN